MNRSGHVHLTPLFQYATTDRKLGIRIEFYYALTNLGSADWISRRQAAKEASAVVEPLAVVMDDPDRKQLDGSWYRPPRLVSILNFELFLQTKYAFFMRFHAFFLFMFIHFYNMMAGRMVVETKPETLEPSTLEPKILKPETLNFKPLELEILKNLVVPPPVQFRFPRLV